MPGALDYDSGQRSAPALQPDTVTPLYCAASCGFIGLVTHLIIMHAEDVNEKCFIGRSPLHAASRNGHADCARILLDHEAHVNAQTTKFADWTPLHFACYDGHLKVAELLLEHEANLNAPDTSNETPLHQASQMGRLEIVRLLLGHGADVSIPGGWRNLTPFQMASESGHRDIAQLLLEHGGEREYVEPDSAN
jgi:ankyrin repeat protein